MKRITIIILFSLVMLECHNADRDEIKRGQEQFFYFAALALYIPNFCEPAQLILEEGQTYNITLEPGKRFWYAYTVTSEFRDSSKKIKLSIIRSNSIKIENINVPCQAFSDEGSNTRTPIVDLPTQLEFQISDLGRFDLNGSPTGQVLRSNERTNIAIKYEIF
ncbi:MAG: hypothetical protein MH321_16060 [Leptospiraceae bacterium]|nr:hypothetical protein [Leptospiraceae bacterium]